MTRPEMLLRTRPTRRLLQLALLSQAPLDRPPVSRKPADADLLDLAAAPVERKEANSQTK